jgi:hypothetical protein
MDEPRWESSRELAEPGSRAEPTRLRVFGSPAVPVVAILVLAGVFDGISGNPIHSILLFATAVALTRDEVRRLRGHRGPMEPLEPLEMADPRGSRRLTLAVMVLAATFALFVGGFGRYSWPATVAILIPGTAVLIVAWRGPVRRSPDPGPLPPAGIVVWSSVFVALALWELSSLLLQSSLTTDSYAHPTISVMTDPVLAGHPGRTAALFLWLAVGWFLLGR